MTDIINTKRLVQRIDALIAQHGGIRPAARALRIDASYLAKMRSGEKNNPSDATLRKLGLRKLIRYEDRLEMKGPM